MEQIPRQPNNANASAATTGQSAVVCSEWVGAPGWYVVDHAHDDAVLRGPYKHEETAAVVRTLLEENANVWQSENWNLWEIEVAPAAQPPRSPDKPLDCVCCGKPKQTGRYAGLPVCFPCYETGLLREWIEQHNALEWPTDALCEGGTQSAELKQ